MQAKISKLKIPIPLTKLVKHDLYKSHITDTLNMNEGEDSVYLSYDQT